MRFLSKVTTVTSLASVAFCALLSAGCSSSKMLDTLTGTGAKPEDSASSDGGTVAAPLGSGLPKMTFSDSDFAENERNRDPFRSFVASTSATTKRTGNVQRDVILPQYSLEELRLVAIVGGGDYPRAMVVDPDGKGWVIKRGDWVGRPELVHIGGVNGADYQVNWRVIKVRDGDVVFTREDPAQPAIQPVSRVIVIRSDGESTRNTL
jgi:type IV pilus assembly protein PilP